MTREQKIAKAKELRDQGLVYREIAERLGVSRPTVYRWLNPDYNERQLAVSRDWKDRNSEHVRAYHRRRRRDSKVDCPRCGGEKTPEATMCRPCHEDEWERKARQVEVWWAEGLTMKEIAERLGTTRNSLCTYIHRLRKYGYDLPYRYTEGRRAGRRFPDQVPA